MILRSLRECNASFAIELVHSQSTSFPGLLSITMERRNDLRPIEAYEERLDIQTESSLSIAMAPYERGRG